MDILTLKSAKKYANQVAAGFSSVTVDGMNIIFTLNDGKTATVTVPAPKDGQDGISVVDVSLDAQSHLICTLSDGRSIDAGEIHQGIDGKDGADGAPGANGKDGIDGKDGEDGRGIVSISKTSSQGLVDTYTITYTDGTTSTFEVTNGSGGGGTSDYLDLQNKPLINSIELVNNKSFEDLGIESLTNTEIEDLIDSVV